MFQIVAEYKVGGGVRFADDAIVELRDLFEPAMVRSAFTERAPFNSVCLIIQFGHRDVWDPVFAEDLELFRIRDDGVVERIDEHWQKLPAELPVRIECDSARLCAMESVSFRRELQRIIAMALEDLAVNFELSSEFLDGILE